MFDQPGQDMGMGEERPTLQVNKLLLMETGTYNDMTYRPYQSNLDMPTLNQFQEATQGGQHVSPEALSGVAGNVLKPAAQPQGQVDIPHGWDTPRLRFLMEVEFPGSMGGSTREIVFGYTDYPGYTANGAIDPQMRLFFNSTVIVRDIEEMAPHGRIMRSSMVDASHVITGDYTPGFGQEGLGQFTMRPEDVFCNMSHSVLGEEAEVHDMRSTFATGVKKSRRSNTSAPNWLARTMRAYQNTRFDDGVSADYSAMMDTARGAVREQLVTQDYFLSTIARANNFNSGVLDQNSISYGELVAMCPYVDNVATIIRPNAVTEQASFGGHRQGVHQRGVSEHWYGSNMETVIATALSNSVPSLMMDLMLTRMAFMATNMTLDGSYSITPVDAQGFSDGVDLTPYIQRFMQRLEYEVLRDLTRNGMIELSLQVDVDVLGETVIDISVDNQPMVRFVNPSFCDALSAPVIGNDPQNLQAITSDIESLASNIDVAHNSPMSAQEPSDGFGSTL